jgi:hypothetical protein
MAQQKKSTQPKPKSRLWQILDERPEKPKATYRTLRKVQKELGGVPDNLMDESGTMFDFDIIGKMYCWLMQQEDETVTEELVRDKIHMGNIHKVIDVINNAYVPEIYVELLPEGVSLDTEPPEKEPEAKASKN